MHLYLESARHLYFPQIVEVRLTDKTCTYVKYRYSDIMYTYVVNWVYNSLSYSSSHKAILSLCMARTLKSSNLINVTVQCVIVDHLVDS